MINPAYDGVEFIQLTVHHYVLVREQGDKLKKVVLINLITPK